MGRVESYDEDQGRLARKISENPFFPIGESLITIIKDIIQEVIPS